MPIVPNLFPIIEHVGTNECSTNLTFSHNRTQKSPSYGRCLKKAKPKKTFHQVLVVGFFKTIMGVKFVDHRHMLKLLARLVTGQCLMIGCSILMLAWKIGYLWLKGPLTQGVVAYEELWRLNGNLIIIIGHSMRTWEYIWDHKNFKESHSSAPTPFLEKAKKKLSLLGAFCLTSLAGKDF